MPLALGGSGSCMIGMPPGAVGLALEGLGLALGGPGLALGRSLGLALGRDLGLALRGLGLALDYCMGSG